MKVIQNYQNEVNIGAKISIHSVKGDFNKFSWYAVFVYLRAKIYL